MPYENGGFTYNTPNEHRIGNSRFDPEEEKVFAHWLKTLKETGVPFVVGGAFAVHAYTGIWRNTKDLDVFIQAKHLKTLLDTFKQQGFESEVAYPNWLGKVHQAPYLLDLIFGIWNGYLLVDEDWFHDNPEVEIAGVSVKIPPMEELIASKVYVASRDRFDGGDVAHLIRAARGKVNWRHVLRHIGDNYEVLLWHFIMFKFVYPGHTDYLPQDLMVELFELLRMDMTKRLDPKDTFRGSLLDSFSYLVDIHDWGYADNRKLDALVDDDGRLLNEH